MEQIQMASGYLATIENSSQREKARRVLFGAVQNKQVAAGVVAFARVNHGHWVAHCPWCAGCEFIIEEAGVFFCHSCKNVAVGGKVIPVKIPTDRKRGEAILLRRPLPENRNWLPGETVDMLRAENIAHGLEA